MALQLEVLLLAAGAAKRFGSSKQLATYDGMPLVRHAALAALTVRGARVTVVLGARAAEVARALAGLPLRHIVNHRWHEGLASSIRCGIAKRHPQVRAVLLMLADQPDVAAPELLRLVRRWRRQPQRMVAARYAGVIGVPAIIPRTYLAAFSKLRGDQGGRHVLRSPVNRVVTVSMPRAARDVDRPQDLMR